MTDMRMRLSIALVVFLVAGCGDDDERPAPTPTATATATAPSTSTASATRTASATPSATATPPGTETVTTRPSPTPTSTRPPLRLPDLHAEPDPERGGRIVDAEGREVLLRGVNVNALAEYWAYGDLPTVFPLTVEDADRMAAIGWNVVRLLLSWSRVEPAPGEYDVAYLEEVRAAVRLFASRGIYTILDLHQDAWGPTLAARPTEACTPPEQSAFGWDGAPGWATLDGGAARCATLGIRELSPAVAASFAAFFDDAPGPGGVGIRTRYVAMLAEVARALAAEPGVAGYDLMNEPNAFFDEDLAQLADLYADAIVAIRAAEVQAGSPSRLVLFEPSAAWALFGAGAPPDFARDRDVVYAPHIYQGGLDGQPLAPGFALAVEDAKRYGGAPVLTGEWGSDPRRASDPEDDYFLAHQALQDEHRIGATLWTWRESCGDPHKAGDVRAGNVPYVWGEFEVDCTTNQVTGVRDDLVGQLARPYVRAAPGRLTEMHYNAQTGRMQARGTDAALGTELLAFYPSSRRDRFGILASGLASVHLVPTASGDTLFVAQARGSDGWSLSLYPLDSEP
jgi:endoglycosylceramidase